MDDMETKLLGILGSKIRHGSKSQKGNGDFKGCSVKEFINSLSYMLHGITSFTHLLDQRRRTFMNVRPDMKCYSLDKQCIGIKSDVKSKRCCRITFQYRERIKLPWKLNPIL